MKQSEFQRDFSVSLNYTHLLQFLHSFATAPREIFLQKLSFRHSMVLKQKLANKQTLKSKNKLHYAFTIRFEKKIIKQLSWIHCTILGGSMSLIMNNCSDRVKRMILLSLINSWHLWLAQMTITLYTIFINIRL